MESANLSSVMALERRVGGPAQCCGFGCTRTTFASKCHQVVAVPAAISLNLLPCNQQVRELEGAVTAAGTDAAAGRAEAKQARAALAALEWRVDKVRGCVLGGSGKGLRLLHRSAHHLEGTSHHVTQALPIKLQPTDPSNLEACPPALTAACPLLPCLSTVF